MLLLVSQHASSHSLIHRTGGVLLAAQQISEHTLNLMQLPQTTTPQNNQQLAFCSDQAENDEQTPFFDMNHEQFDSIFVVKVKEYASVIIIPSALLLYQVLPPCIVQSLLQV